MGLLDAFLTQGTTPPNPDATFPQLLSSPMGQGLLGTIASYAANARRGAPVNSIGAGLLGGLSAYSNAGQEDLKRQYMQAQMSDMAQQQELRRQQAAQLQRKQSLLEELFPKGAPSQPAMPGQLGSGSFGAVTPAPGLPDMPAPNPVAGLASRLTPDLLARLKLGAGEDLTDIYKLTQPDMQVSNGYAYDKRTLKPGYLPQLSTSQDGKTSLVQIGRDGMPVVSAPAGALDTFARYQNVQEGTKANYDPVTVTPQGENPQMTTRGALVRNPVVSGRVTPQEQAARDTDRQSILTQELGRARTALNQALSSGDQSAAARAQGDIAALERELGGRRPSVGMPLQSEEEKLRASEGVKSDAKRNEALTGEAQKSKDTLANITEARRLLKQKPTSSGVGALVDAGANFVGASTKGADVAAQLDTLSGWMVNNVPRMEGPQSNFDVQNYKTMAALVGDRTKPLSQRMAALDTLEKLQNKYAHLNGGSNVVNSGGATGTWEASGKPLPANPNASTLTKGETYTLPNGKTAVWDGFSFKVK
jgi:hypothetical protein